MSALGTESERDLTEVRLSSERLLEGRFLKIDRDTVRLPDGATATREWVRHPGAVVVVPLAIDGRALMERQFRYPLGRVMLEFPAGKLDAGETVLACAQRELKEETGYSAKEWAYAGAMHNAIAYSDEVIHICFAKGLVAGQAQPDAGEFVEVFWASLDQALEAVRAGTLTDAKSITCITWWQNHASGAWHLPWQAAN